MGESLLARTRFQAFLFAGGVIILFSSLVTTTPDVATKTAIIDKMFWLAISAMFAFVIALVIHAIRPNAGVLENALPAPKPSVQPWPTRYDVRLARGFMLLGVLIYLGYHFLDGFVIADPSRVLTILYIRVGVSGSILCVWLLTFADDWFRRHYTTIITLTTCIAGTGVGAMMFVAGSQVHFYYEGFIQVIAFAAFAFRLPARPLAWECAYLLSLYTAIAAFQNWQPGTGLVVDQSLRAALVNNLVSLLTFVALSVSASVALGKRDPSPGGEAA